VAPATDSATRSLSLLLRLRFSMAASLPHCDSMDVIPAVFTLMIIDIERPTPEIHFGGIWAFTDRPHKLAFGVIAPQNWRG